jgi:hypothetical protein
MLTVEQVKEKREEILEYIPESLLDTCRNFSVAYVTEAAIIQILSPSISSPEFTLFCNFVEENLEEFLIFSEDEIREEFDNQEVTECPQCGWWCNDVHNESEECDEDVCGSCAE